MRPDDEESTEALRQLWRVEVIRLPDWWLAMLAEVVEESLTTREQRATEQAALAAEQEKDGKDINDGKDGKDGREGEEGEAAV